MDTISNPVSTYEYIPTNFTLSGDRDAGEYPGEQMAAAAGHTGPP